MMLKKLFIGLVILTLLGIIYIRLWPGCNCTKDKVCIKVLNISSHVLNSVQIEYGSLKIKSGRINKNSDTCLTYPKSGENTFVLSAILDNEDTLDARIEYSEGGYKFKATVTDQRIDIQFND